MQSLITLHRSIMQAQTSDEAERVEQLRRQKSYPERAAERRALQDFLKSQGLDRAARMRRRPKLELVVGNRHNDKRI